MANQLWSFEHTVAVGDTIMTALGTPPAAADQVARSLAGANLCGHDSHGVIRLPWYAEFVADGRAVPTAEPAVVGGSGPVIVIDGQRCWGQVAAHRAAELAGNRAREDGVAVVTVRQANHVGRLGEYAERLADDGLITIAWANADPSVAPFGGRDRMLGTNPFAAGIPCADGPPVIVDFATAAVAEGKLRLSRVAGTQVAAGLIQDVHGHPSTDPEDFYAGGALLAFGQHKGFGLALLVELLGGALSGNHVGFLPEYRWGNGMVLIALDPSAFGAREAILAEIGRACRGLRASAPAAGVDHVLLPGDVEERTRAERTEHGIPVPDEVRVQLVELARSLGVDLP